MSREKPNDDGDPAEARCGMRDKEGDMLLRGDRERQGGSGIAEGVAVTGERKGGEARGIRSDRDVRSDLVGESNLAK